MGCGHFMAGCEWFDFSEVPGLCPDCLDELKADMGLHDEQYDQQYGDMLAYDADQPDP